MTKANAYLSTFALQERLARRRPTDEEIRQALADARGNKSHAANALGHLAPGTLSCLARVTELKGVGIQYAYERRECAFGRSFAMFARLVPKIWGIRTLGSGRSAAY